MLRGDCVPWRCHANPSKLCAPQERCKMLCAARQLRALLQMQVCVRATVGHTRPLEPSFRPGWVKPRRNSHFAVSSSAAHALLLALLRSLAAVTKSNGFGETVAAMATLSAATAGEALYDTARSCQLASCIAAISLGCVRMSQAAQTMQLKSWYVLVLDHGFHVCHSSD